VQLEESAQEAGDEQEVLLAVRQVLGAALGVVETPGDVGQVAAQRGHALSRDVLADEAFASREEQQSRPADG